MQVTLRYPCDAPDGALKEEGKQGLLDTLNHSSEVVACEFHPTNKDELISTTLGS